MRWTRQTLITHLAAGNTVSFLLFWGHTPKKADVIDQACLSQWYPASFEVDGIAYPTAEHFMMAEKARLFGDEEALANILACKSPAEAKSWGRTVRNYDDVRWGHARSEAVVRGNVAKFSSSPDLRRFLERTNDRVLVEASPRDRIWGIGMGASNPDARDPSKWRGSNLLGFALMEARSRLG